MQDLHDVTTEPTMARLSRAERRRMTARDAVVRQTPRSVEDIINEPSEESPIVAEPVRTVRTTRRVTRVAEHVDYTAEYRIIGHDLRRIALWGTLLIAIMIGIRFSGLV